MAKVALRIPHSNAAEERVFSVIRKIKRDDRGKLKLEGTVSSLVSSYNSLSLLNLASLLCSDRKYDLALSRERHLTLMCLMKPPYEVS